MKCRGYLESLELAEDGLPARVEMVEEFGADSYVFCAASVAGQQTKLVARVETRRAPARGDRVALRPKQTRRTSSTPKRASGSSRSSGETNPRLPSSTERTRPDEGSMA